MNSLRLVSPSDLDSLVQLAKHASFGLTTLSPNPDRLAKRIEQSIAGDAPLLVMVDSSDINVIGTAGLFTRVGNAQTAEPFYAYRIERSVHHSASLNVHLEIDVLHLLKMFHGPTELGTFFLHPDHRGCGAGRVLSLSRFLLMALHPNRFERQIIAELRGVNDQSGRSPFWDAIGQHFFQIDFAIADALSAADKKFIAELMPTHPIYVPLLPDAAQAVIAQVHPQTAPARQLLESEGFYFSNMVDIFDGGPCLRCDAAAIRTIRESTLCRVAAIEQSTFTQSSDAMLIARATGDFRLVGGRGLMAWHPAGDQGVVVTPEVATTLQLEMGDTVLVSPLRGKLIAFGSQWPILAARAG
jgi:arginine N-succinyltransferase